MSQVIGSLCREKETITLKQICSQLAAKPLALDVLLLFDKAHKIIHPLCELLDNWAGYEEDQGEYQPVYEEFGSILLLLLAFVYRYNLTRSDLGIRLPSSFVGRLLNGGTLWRPVEELSEQEKSHLDGWIHGLFDTEAGGLGDELMASCPPQDFYLLVPSLFHQIVLALSMGRLTHDMLSSGLECKHPSRQRVISAGLTLQQTWSTSFCCRRWSRQSSTSQTSSGPADTKFRLQSSKPCKLFFDQAPCPTRHPPCSRQSST